jgi:uncharacterized protein (DUF4415 family)
MTSRKLRQLSEEEIQAQIAADHDDAEATDEELAQAKPFAEVFPDWAAEIARKRGRPPVAEPRTAVTLRVAPATLERFRRRAGKEWRARMSELLDKADP